MTKNEYEAVSALLKIAPRLEPFEKMFTFRLLKFRDKDLSRKGRGYLFRLLAIYKKQIPEFKKINLARLYEVHGDSVQDIYKVLCHIRDKTDLKRVPVIVWPSGVVKTMIKKKGSKKAMMYTFKAKEFLPNFLMKLASLGFINDCNGQWRLTTMGDTFLYAYIMGDQSADLPPFTQSTLLDPDLFEENL